MADNNDIMNTLMNILGNDDAKEKIMETIGSLSGSSNSEPQTVVNESEETKNSITKPSFPMDTGLLTKDNMDMVVKIKNLMDRFNNNDDNRITLLNAIRPYMKATRLKNIDLAVNFIKLINFSTGFKGL